MSPDFIRRAVEDCNLNALRLALFQVTDDPTFAAFGVDQAPMNGGASLATVVRASDRQTLIDLAVEYLGQPLVTPTAPRPEAVRPLIEQFVGRPVNDDEFALSSEQLAFGSAIEDFARRAPAVRAAMPDDFHVLVVGAGFGGIASAIYLKQLGIPFTIVDRQQRIGGTWQANQYPDVRVDIPNRFYQYTFEQTYPWTHRFAPGAEVRDYIEHVASKFGVADRLRTGVEVRRAAWDEMANRWDVEFIENGTPRTMRVNAIISAAGLFNKPLIPDIPGRDDFRGPAFHTTAWPADLDVAGKRVAVIGTGSTGCQLVPRIAETAGKVVVFQRSPNWVQPAVGYHDQVPQGEQWLLETVPYYANWVCFGFHWHSTQDLPGLQELDQEWVARGGINERNAKLREYLVDTIRERLGGDEALLAKCIPDHAPWTRRMVKDNGWYEALLRPNVELVASRVARVDPDAVVADDGTRHPADILVLSTGFVTEDYLWPVDYVGRGGTAISAAWEKDGARAYLGLTMPGFPNLFMLYGPNSQPRSGSMPKWLEIWGRYAADGIATMLERDARSVEVRRETFDDYNRDIDAATKTLIWTSAGKSSYYVNRFGRTSVNMPWRAERYYRHVGSFAPNDYIFG
ncbi:MAG: NAD(P)/FAD-dependent oxidoreductase [Sphingomonas sp.]|uniref:flavin-containing monooxygenase n=1 Tax=Sphingomonas sp. TaxID=28214 RepID=UPI0025F554E0|nr:NAD(P)/FAD-dependent oxidoreductase [Sphingomonas sp.]MBX3564154.1 NAD(P)/FAD-dependent oxidoreductase [Sphingomonas sp.]